MLVAQGVREIGRFLAQYRRDKGLSSRALAGEVGVAPQTLQTLEDGAETLNLRTLRKVASALGLRLVIALETED